MTRLTHRRLQTTSSRTGLALVVAVLCGAFASDVSAQNPNWPPPESATVDDMADPANWPDDPGYHYCPSDSPYCGEDQKSDGQWNYYSFVPTQSGNLTLRPEETSSGMSIDLAWRYTQGDDRVRIAVMDSGIKWDEGDLLDRAWLNPVELQNHKPTMADGMPCGGTDELEGFDCNADGIFSVSDYADTPTLQPAADMNTLLGDVNGNGVLDGGDIIQNFSDGIDDDGNGYVDDISGWDFMKDDNNPYDDTRYGHGTGEARDSTATGNDGRGAIGGCPNCRFMPMRVGDSFIADVSAFAQAVVYAVDNGAMVVQCALGTIDMNPFAQQALDYSYNNGVLNVISMADENARHHNMPATANHTLPVHAIQFSPNNRITNAESFLDFNPCTNFGAQNFLSVAGTGCSSEAVGQLSGMSGLMFSAALKYDVQPPLTAAEAMQIWIKTADDIDVPESRETDDGPNKWFWSQPGFDQRFGYGRTNANSAIEWIKDGKIPPEVDMVRPYWFEVLYRDQLTGPVEIRGHVSASRATSYDYVVEWAPGVEPLDDAFIEIASEKNVPGDTVTGGEEPVALFDVRTIDTTHEPDADSKLGENEHTITVRIRAEAHYGGDIGDVRGEMRRAYYVHSDPDLVKGFPMYLGASGEGSPKMADIDGDGKRDLVYPTSDGRMHVLRLTSDGAEYVDGFPTKGPRIDGLSDTPVEGKPNYLTAPAYASGDVDPSNAHSSFVSAPAVADIDGDGDMEIVATSWNGFISVFEHDGAMKNGFPIRLPEVPSCPRDGSVATGPCGGDPDPTDETGSPIAIIDRGAFGAPVLEDMDKDGDLDIIQAAFDGGIYVFTAEGELMDGWPVFLHYDGPLSEEPDFGRILTTPAVADFNGDGYPDILTGSNEALGNGKNSGAAYLIDGRGTNADTPVFENWPVTMNSLNIFPLVAEGLTNSGVVGTFDGQLAGVIHGNGSSPLILPADPGPQPLLNETPGNVLPEYTDPESGESRRGVAPTGQFGAISTASRPDVMFPLFANPSLADIDQDGIIDIVASGSSLSLAQSLLGSSSDSGQQLIAVWSGATGEMIPGSPFMLEDYSFFNSHAIADITGDDYPEIIAGSGGYFLHAYDGCGREPEGWPKFTGQWIIPTPALGDMDGDGSLEVAIGTRNGWLYVWHTKGSSEGQIEWESFHHDNRNTGNYDVPLEQGDASRRAAEPLTVEFCEAALAGPKPMDGLEPGGGCGCIVAGDDDSDWRGLWAGLLGLGLIGARRRRRR
jgi:MYXO-CTERM domain-containing protein